MHHAVQQVVRPNQAHSRLCLVHVAQQTEHVLVVGTGALEDCLQSGGEDASLFLLPDSGKVLCQDGLRLRQSSSIGASNCIQAGIEVVVEEGIGCVVSFLCLGSEPCLGNGICKCLLSCWEELPQLHAVNLSLCFQVATGEDAVSVLAAVEGGDVLVPVGFVCGFACHFGQCRSTFRVIE